MARSRRSWASRPNREAVQSSDWKGPLQKRATQPCRQRATASGLTASGLTPSIQCKTSKGPSRSGTAAWSGTRTSQGGRSLPDHAAEGGRDGGRPGWSRGRRGRRDRGQWPAAAPQAGGAAGRRPPATRREFPNEAAPANPRGRPGGLERARATSAPAFWYVFPAISSTLLDPPVASRWVLPPERRQSRRGATVPSLATVMSTQPGQRGSGNRNSWLRQGAFR